MTRMFVARVLVIEDEAGVRALIQRALEPKYEIHTARDGEEGIKQAAAVKPDLILLDLRMPGLTGLEVLARLKASQDTSEIPVVVVSMQGETDILIDCQRAGAVDQIIKPFSVEDLRKVIRRQLSGFG